MQLKMKKNIKTKLFGLAACVLLSLFAVGCNKDKDEITEEEARVVLANAEVVMNNVSRIYESSATVEEMAQHLDEIKAMPNVENAYQDDIAICVKIKDGGVIMWCYYPEEEEEEKAVDIEELFKNISNNKASGKGGSLCEKKSICLLNVINRPGENGYEEVVTKCKKMLDWDTCIRKGEQVTPDIILNYLPDNGVTILVTHGLYSDGQHWLLTGQFYNDVRVHFPKLIELWGEDLNRLVVFSKEEEAKIVISETFLDLFITKKFPQNSIVYSAACETFKGNNSLWLKLKDKGLGCMLGFNRTVPGSTAMNCCVAFMKEMLDGKTACGACETARGQISFLIERFDGLKLLCYPENCDIILVDAGERACLDKDKLKSRLRRTLYNPRSIVFEYNSCVTAGERLDSEESQVPIYGNLNDGVYTISTSSNQIYAPSDCSSLFGPLYDDWVGFDYLSSVEEIDFGVGFNTENVTDMSGMFDGCSSLTSLNLPGWNTENVTDMSGMFDGCSSLTSLNLPGWNTENVTNMSSMFEGCYDLTSLNLSGWNTENVTNMSSMFEGCYDLTSLNLSGWNTGNVTNMGGVFHDCSSLTSLNLSGWNTGSAMYMGGMFSDCSSLTSLNLSGWNTGSAMYMGGMFSDCSNLTSLNLSGWNTGNVTEMCYMFEACSSLTSLNLSGWNTRNVTDMCGMFEGCSSLTSLNLSGWNTGNVTDMSDMFWACSSLTNLNLSGWNTGRVTDMSAMFEYCSRLISLNLSGWNTGNVTDMSEMFKGCSSLTSLNLANFDMSNVSDKFNMCYSLASMSHACTITCTSATQTALSSYSTGLDEDYITWIIVGKKKSAPTTTRPKGSKQR